MPSRAPHQTHIDAASSRSLYRTHPVYAPHPIHWHEAGRRDAPKLILLHGVMAHGNAWRQIAPLLHDHYHLIMLDLPGHGRDMTHHHPDLEPSVEALSSWVRHACDLIIEEYAHHEQPFHLVGHSLGALAAMSALREFPTAPFARTCSTLTLISPGVRFGMASLTTSQLMKHVPARAARAVITPIGFRIFEPIQWRAAARMSRDERKRYLAPIRHPERFPFIYKLMRDVADQHNRIHGVHTIPHPTLILWGKQDWMLPSITAHHLAEQMPDARAHVFEQCGHCPMEDHPLAVALRLSTFLRTSR